MSHTSTLYFFMLISSLPMTPIWAQVPTIQDCLGAIPICEEVYVESTSPKGQGNYAGEILSNLMGGPSCMFDESNSIWYTFTVNKSGDFGFILTPKDPTDDYDWSLFDITNAVCSDVLTQGSIQVSCNAAGGGVCNGATGATGASTHKLQGGGCGHARPGVDRGMSPFNSLISVEESNTYVLLVSNFTGSVNGYTLDFSPSGDIGIFDDRDPTVAEILPPLDCGKEGITVRFSEHIDLTSIDNDNFSVSGPAGLHEVELSSNAQDINADYEKIFVLNLNPPASTPGTYTLNVMVDGQNDILDLCGNPMRTSPGLSFECNCPPDVNYEEEVSICFGDTFSFAGQQLYTPGVYHDTIIRSGGCDSTSTLILLVKGIPDPPFEAAICVGEYYPFGGRELRESGTYFDTLVNSSGCDSVITLQLDVQEEVADTLKVSIPEGESYEVGGGTYDVSGFYEIGSVDTSARCKHTILDLSIVEPSGLYLPNTVNPWSKVGNDRFLLYSEESVTVRSVQIFDRWGSRVYERGDELGQGTEIELWNGIADGRAVNSGVYLYLVLVEDEYGQIRRLAGDLLIAYF